MESTKQITTVYHFDAITLEYTGSGDAHIGPAGDVQLPAFSSLVAPGEVPVDKVALAANVDGAGASAWTLVDDRRSMPVFRTADGEHYQLGTPLAAAPDGWNGLGEIPAGLTAMPKPDGHYIWNGSQWTFDLEAAKAAAITDVDLKCEAVLQMPFGYGGHTFSGDAASIGAIASAASLAAVAKLANQPYSVIWTSSDDVDVTLDADGMIALAMAAAGRLAPAQQIARQLKDRIAAAADEAALAAVVWPS